MALVEAGGKGGFTGGLSGSGGLKEVRFSNPTKNFGLTWTLLPCCRKFGLTCIFLNFGLMNIVDFCAIVTVL